MKHSDRILQLETKVAKVEKGLEHAHEKILVVEDKKLSKHEFNNLTNVVQALKDSLTSAIRAFESTMDKQHESTAENTQAITALQTTFSDVRDFLPILLRVILWAAGMIVALILFIGSKLMGLW